MKEASFMEPARLIFRNRTAIGYPIYAIGICLAPVQHVWFGESTAPTRI